MSAKNMKCWILIFGLLSAFGASAGENRFPYVFHDPLFTAPDLLTDGLRLPGDTDALDCPAPVGAKDTFDFKEPLALSVAVDMALCRNPQVRYAWAAIKVQAGALGEAKAAYLPTLNASVSKLHNTTNNLSGMSPQTSSSGKTKNYGLTWRLFDFGARAANLEAAHATLAAALASHDAALQKVLVSVIQGYFDALSAQATLASRTQAARLAQSTFEATQRREKLGVAAVSDSLQAQTALAKARLALNRAQGDLNKTQSVLLYAMGLPPGTEVLLPDELATSQAQRVDELAHWLEEAQAKHPAIAAARAQLAAAQAKVKASSTAGLPTLDYSQNYYENGYPNQGLNALGTGVHTVGFVLSIPLFDGFATTYKIRGAQAQAEQSEAQLQDTQHQILMEVVKAHADAQSAFENLQASERLLTSAQAAVESSQKRYDKGAADILELLSTQNALTDAQQERLRCLSDWQSARLRLMANAGMMGRVSAK